MQVIGVSFDPPPSNQKFKDNNEFPYPLWTDTEKELALHYGAATSKMAIWAKRRTILLGPQGQWLLYYDPTSKLAEHPGQVLEDCAKIFGAAP